MVAAVHIVMFSIITKTEVLNSTSVNERSKSFVSQF